MLIQRPVACFAIAVFLTACAGETPSPAPAPVVAQPSPAPVSLEERNAFDFKIGSLSAVALRDGRLRMPNDGKVFAINRKPEEVARLLAAAGLPTTELSLSLQPLLVKAGDRVLLFDTGAGTNMGPVAGKILDALQEAAVDPASITDIFISHAHGDHVGGLLGAEGALTFPNATVHLTAAEWAFLRGMKNEAAVVAAIAPKVDAFKPGSELIQGLVSAVEIRGHTPGHSAYLIGGGSDTLLYVGDVVHHYLVSVQQPDWTIAFDSDALTAQQSRKEVLDRNAASGQRIYAVHLPFPGLGKFERQGEQIVWVPEN